MNDGEIINYLNPTEVCSRYLYQVEKYYIKIMMKKALFVDAIPTFAIVIAQFINETDSLTASRKLMKSHLTKHVQDLYNLSTQYNDLKSLLYYMGTIVTILVLYFVTHLLTSDGDHYQNVAIHLLEQKIKR